MVKVLEQYTTKLTPEEHERMQVAAKWLNENGFLPKINKYEITKYALQTLIGIVDDKRKRLEADSKLAKEFREKNSEEKSKLEQGFSSVKETQQGLSSGGQDA